MAFIIFAVYIIFALAAIPTFYTAGWGVSVLESFALSLGLCFIVFGIPLVADLKEGVTASWLEDLSPTEIMAKKAFIALAIAFSAFYALGFNANGGVDFFIALSALTTIPTTFYAYAIYRAVKKNGCAEKSAA